MSHSDDLDSDAGSEPDLDDVADDPGAPASTPGPSNSDLPHPNFAPSPSASCTPSPEPLLCLRLLLPLLRLLSRNLLLRLPPTPGTLGRLLLPM